MTEHRMFDGPIGEEVASLPLVDHHVHGALRSDVSRGQFESMITEAPEGSSAGTQFDSQVGFAIRRWCSPYLGLPVHATADDYWQARVSLGNQAVSRRLLGAAGVSCFLLDTGYLGDAILGVAEHAAVAGSTAKEVVRLETVAESLLTQVGSGSEFVTLFPERLTAATADAVGLKSIVAYRYGFDFAPERPSDGEVRASVDTLLAREPSNVRIDDPVLLRYLLWCGVDRGLPLQLHTGYGDPDLDLHRANPVLLTGWLRQVEPTRVPIMLLHCYPYHREAGYLAQVFDNVYFDVGLGINYVGAQSRQLVAESFEVAPFHKQLYSSDAWGPAELHLLGSMLWRRAVSDVVGQWVADGDWSRADAVRVLGLIGSENATRVYRL
ncbi:amidohydrolase family protein [Segeticoccus sp.]|uniref:amidohydrolase family protein n=1 Tax=Segeticoccus sp. TaxID=2706531 RepID=UPI002D7E91F6|nr:amidohydrolase family protein [Segeticoccus sp.]